MYEMETIETKKILTKGMPNRILALMNRRIDNYKWESLPDFVEQMLALNKVICYKCRKPIDVGSYLNAASGGRSRKYYHGKCWEGLFH